MAPPLPMGPGVPREMKKLPESNYRVTEPEPEPDPAVLIPHCHNELPRPLQRSPLQWVVPRGEASGADHPQRPAAGKPTRGLPVGRRGPGRRRGDWTQGGSSADPVRLGSGCGSSLPSHQKTCRTGPQTLRHPQGGGAHSPGGAQAPATPWRPSNHTLVSVPRRKHDQAGRWTRTPTLPGSDSPSGFSACEPSARADVTHTVPFHTTSR